MMLKTRFERLETINPEIAGFRVEGKLGFHENEKMERLVDECLKRGFSEVIFDFSGLSSLGGGVARILRSFIATMDGQGKIVKFVITNNIVLDFLRDEGAVIRHYKTMDEAYRSVVAPGVKAREGSPREAAEEKAAAGASAVERIQGEGGLGEAAGGGATAEGRSPANDVVISMPWDGESRLSGGREEPREPKMVPGTESAILPEVPREPEAAGIEEIAETENTIISEIFERGQAEPDRRAKAAVPAPAVVSSLISTDADELNRKLKRRILELKTLFSISSDFNAIKDKKNLLDIFLLTSIAQGGVESAVFYEKTEGRYEPSILKGYGENDMKIIILPPEVERKIAGTSDVMSVDSGTFGDEVSDALRSAGLEYFCPFIIKEGIAGLIFLGRRIAGRGMQKEDFEFMKILINVAAGAYQNALMLEREHERTLGIVKTLISLIEENTLLTGTSEFVSRYVGMVAKNMDYPEESFKDLVYGTVLRDMGMIKVSDLIVRSPRELTRDEWNIINKHPEDGAEMLRRMKFSDHVVQIVLSHHERFNGEGYPRGLRGKEIPHGARIISVIESYSAMIHERPNRPALSSQEALDTLKENYGLRYDREVVRQFARIMEKEMARSVRPAVAVS
jgi:HD-GYP domain-containing protein (c-di-GMP phosphodiesterase class II)